MCVIALGLSKLQPVTLLIIRHILQSIDIWPATLVTGRNILTHQADLVGKKISSVCPDLMHIVYVFEDLSLSEG